MNLIQKTLCCLLITLSVKGITQSPKFDIIPYRKGKLWGFCDSTKKVIITPRFDSVEIFETFQKNDTLPRKRVALVWKNKKVGLINDMGKELVPCSFQEAYVMNYERGRRRVAFYKQINSYESHSYGYYLDEKKLVKIKKWLGNDEYMGPPGTLIPAKMLPSDLDTNLTVKRITADSFLIIRKQISYWNDQQFYKVDSFILQAQAVEKIKYADSILFVKKRDGWGIFSLSRNEILPAIYDSIRRIWWADIFACKKDGQWQAIQLSRNRVSPSWYQDIQNNPLSEGLLVKKNNCWGILRDDFLTEIWINPVLYNKYEVMEWYPLIRIFDRENRLFGYAGLDGMNYWD